jgi:hypothetical protein
MAIFVFAVVVTFVTFVGFVWTHTKGAASFGQAVNGAF